MPGRLDGSAALGATQTQAEAHLVMSAVVSSLRSCLSTMTAADLKMPPPPFSIFTPFPRAVLGSSRTSWEAGMHPSQSERRARVRSQAQYIDYRLP